MDKIKVNILLKEANHSMALLMKATNNVECLRLMSKWPDIFESYIEDDDTKFIEDISTIICIPLKSMAESYIERLGSMCKMSNKLDFEYRRIASIMVESKIDPVLAKFKLINICNLAIASLKENGLDFQPIEGRK